MRILLAVILALAPVGAEPTFRLTPHAANTLHYLFNNLEVEFAFCAYGKKKDGVITINNVILPVINAASAGTVWYDEKTCSTKNLLGYGHSHPGESVCQLSRIDLYSFMSTAPPFHFLVCKDEMRAFVRADVRSELIKAGKLAEILIPPWRIP